MWPKGLGELPQKCEAPMKMRKGRCVMSEPEVAKCEHPNVYRKGKGCVPRCRDDRRRAAFCGAG